MMNILHFSQSVKWSSWFICSLLLHGLIFLAFIWRFSEVQPTMSPAPAIMLQWAEIIEAPSSPLSLPVGIAQQESTEKKAILIGLMKKIVPIFSLSSTQGKDVKMTAF